MASKKMTKEEERSTSLRVRLTEDELRKAHVRAHQARMTLSEWVRELMRKGRLA